MSHTGTAARAWINPTESEQKAETQIRRPSFRLISGLENTETAECAIGGGGNSLALIQSSQSAVTVFLTGEEASHGTGSYKPITCNPDPAILSRTYRSDSIVSPAPSAIAGECPLGRSSQAQLGFDLHLHHSPKTILDRHEHERKPTEILYLQASWGRAITFHIRQRRGRSLRREGSYDKAVCGVGMVGRIQRHGGPDWLCGDGADADTEVSVRLAWRKVLDSRSR